MRDARAQKQRDEDEARSRAQRTRIATVATQPRQRPPPHVMPAAMPPVRCASCGATDELEADASQPRVRYCRGCWAWWRAQSEPRVQCAGMTRMRTQCRISSWDEHVGARPLWEGGTRCAHHLVPPGAACASCGGTGDLNMDPSDGAWYCRNCWDQWQV